MTYVDAVNAQHADAHKINNSDNNDNVAVHELMPFGELAWIVEKATQLTEADMDLIEGVDEYLFIGNLPGKMLDQLQHELKVRYNLVSGTFYPVDNVKVHITPPTHVSSRKVRVSVSDYRVACKRHNYHMPATPSNK